jgi:hypothetical protein
MFPIISAATTSHLTYVLLSEDRFYNYDFLSTQASSSNVDWPVSMLFYGNADINKIKLALFGLEVIASPMYELLDDGSGWVWDSDRGTKEVHYSYYLNRYVYLHMRIYAPSPPDYFNDELGYYGHYVIGTTHYDEYPFESWSGYSEYAEKDVGLASKAIGWTVFEDHAFFNNPEPFRIEGTHVWDNNGYATFVYVP